MIQQERASLKSHLGPKRGAVDSNWKVWVVRLRASIMMGWKQTDDMEEREIKKEKKANVIELSKIWTLTTSKYLVEKYKSHVSIWKDR